MNQECTVRIEKLELHLHEVVEAQEKENSNTTNCPDLNGIQTPAKRYRTRSSVSKTESTETHVQIQRKQRPLTEPKPKPQFIDYKGKVEYYTEFCDIAFASDNLL